MPEEKSIVFNLDLGVQEDIFFPGPDTPGPTGAASGHEEEEGGTPQERFERLQRRARTRLKEALEIGSSVMLAEVFDDYGRLLEMDPEQLEPYLVLGYLSLELGCYAHACRLLESAIRLDPFNTKAQKLLREARAAQAAHAEL